jgi:hypothetical protein
MSAPSGDDDAFLPYISHEEFRSGVAAGRLRLVVDPTEARRYVELRAHVVVLTVAVIGIGAATALAGLAWTGGTLVAAGIAARRLLRWQAPRIALHLALKDPAVYAEVTSNGVLEVRRAS